MTNLNPLPTMKPAVSPLAGPPLLFVGSYDLASLGYTAEEFIVSGEATSYRPTKPLQTDGRWDVGPESQAPYVTRVVVLRPEKPLNFNGTLLVEWLNVSSGMDAPAEWLMTHRELIRSGYAYAAVSAQKVGISGGASLGADMSLKTMDPVRYASLTHPGDAFSFDIFSQVGRLFHDTALEIALVGAWKPTRVLAAGESQSAHFLTTYVNAVDPIAQVYDGFFIHSRFSSSAPIDGRSIMNGVLDDIPDVVRFRPDLRVPVMTVITETDLLGGARSGYYNARQADNDKLRTWEIPGSAHADNYMLQVGAIDTGSAALNDIVRAYSPTKDLMGTKLEKALNFAPQHHYVAEAALSCLNDWVRGDRAPPMALRIESNGEESPALVLDANGMARGGVRTPWIDVPIAWTSGMGSTSSIMAALFGAGEAFNVSKLADLYPGGIKEYLFAFTASLDTAIHAGFILAADRQEIIDLATAQFSLAN